MRKFNVTVNGQTYEVEVEELDGTQSSEPARTISAPAPKPAASASKPAAKPAAAPAGAGDPIKAPMPGNILDVRAKAGDKVKSGDPIVILEAMKMENPIPAPRDGTITSITVSKGVTVEAGQVLATIQ